ncbi:MAG: glutamate synthase (NADPH), homotetrameric [Chloroflexi bacterium HGW-Chloroflexi-1]|nr:MAG: glutamate synthase (NADPH), homotetrameric [Chloroflexi bacterium HGW-Chloroflexi-1]
MSPLSNKERMQIKRQDMPAQEPEVRRGNFDEVALGLTWELAKLEAERCLQCAKPKCIEGCPVGVLIPQFIQALREGDFIAAVEAMKQKNNLPAICGRVCPQESQCEAVCVLSKKGQSVAIGRLERYVGDFALREQACPPVPAPPTGKKVAVVGSGPAGLTCAVDLAKLGHKVTIFESLHLPGGVLVYGIPEFRLPKAVIAAEIATAVQHLGIEIRTNHVIGRTITLNELLAEYDAIFLGTGAGLPSFMRIPGINYNGVFSANEFLTRVNLMKGYLFPEYDTPVKVGQNVAVIGAGNVAMDSARSALRLQRLAQKPVFSEKTGFSGEVHIVYRRSAEEVPARAEEVEHAHEEGIIFDFLTNPIEILGDAKGNVCGMRCIRMELGEPDDSGRRRPVPIAGSEFEMPVDEVIMALGTSPNPLVFEDADGLERSKHGTVIATEPTGRTTKARVWAGGDVVTGAATVISAMGAGKQAAADIHESLSDETLFDVG